MLAGAWVFAQFQPVDAARLEAGDAVWVQFVILAAGIFAAVGVATDAFQNHRHESPRGSASPRRENSPRGVAGSTRAVGIGQSGDASPEFSPAQAWACHLLPWGLAGWTSLAGVLACPPGNVRMATNEAWFWWSAAVLHFTAVVVMRSDLGHSDSGHSDGWEHLGRGATFRRAAVWALVVAGVYQAVHAIHQAKVSLPELRRSYQSDPSAVIAAVGLDAPAGSAARMVFENRLADGGPTGTFVLANSVAGILSMALIAGLGVLLRESGVFADQGDRGGTSVSERPARWRPWAVLASVAVLAFALVLTRSRSAVGATMIAAGILVALAVGRWLRIVGAGRSHASDKDPPSPGGRPSRRRRRRRLVALLVVLPALVLCGWIWRDRGSSVATSEWIGQAAPSLAFRFQYWRSTLRMVRDAPLTGAGPGNFRGVYERYREPTAHEQIAEPHNFFFETLASGGVPGGFLLLAFLAMVGLAARHQWRRGARFDLVRRGWIDSEPTDVACRNTSRDVVSSVESGAVVTLPARGNSSLRRWLTLGGACGLGLIVLLGPLVGASPDWEPFLIAAPIAAAVGGLFWPLTARLRSADLTRIAVGVLVALGIHLCVAGGWTVMGIAVPAWIFLATITADVSPPFGWAADTPAADTPTGAAVPSPAWFPALYAACIPVAVMTVLSVVFYAGTVRPMQTVTIESRRAAADQSRGRIEAAERSLRRAAAADRWVIDPAVQLEGVQRMMYLAGPKADRSRSRQRWLRSLDDLLRRGVVDPAIAFLGAKSRLHAFQRYGDAADLSAAETLLRRASRNSPSHETIMAQYAAVCDALGYDARARSLARRARELSLSGGNIERHLSRQRILVPVAFGRSVVAGPRTAAAEDLIFRTTGSAAGGGREK